MKKTIFLVIILLFAFSAEGVELKIGYVDINKALNESDNGKKATKILEDMVNSKKPIFLEKEEELKKLEEELKKQSSVLTPEAKKSKEEQFNKLLRDYQRMLKDFNEELQKKQEEFTQEIQRDLIEIINKFAEEEGYSIIFEKGSSGIIYSPKKFDVTDNVLKRYNETAKAKK